MKMKLSVAIALVIATSLSLAAEEIVNKQYGFRLNVPDGFASIPIAANDKVTVMWYIKDDDETPYLIGISRMTGTIGRNHRFTESEKKDEAFKETTFSEITWENLTLDVLRTVRTEFGKTLVFYTIAYPLPGEAVTLYVGGPVERDAEVKRLLDELNSSFVSLNDKRPQAREEKVHFIVESVLTLIGVVCAFSFICYLFVRHFRERKKFRDAQSTTDDQGDQSTQWWDNSN